MCGMHFPVFNIILNKITHSLSKISGFLIHFNQKSQDFFNSLRVDKQCPSNESRLILCKIGRVLGHIRDAEICDIKEDVSPLFKRRTRSRRLLNCISCQKKRKKNIFSDSFVV